MNGSPSASPMSYTRQTFGCDTWRAMRTSLWKRSRQFFVGGGILRQELQGDGLPERQVVARYTSPMPPRPISPIMR